MELIQQKKPALLVLAAGMGSRYGGLKQIDAMGPSGQTMPDYAVEDALRAGFGKVIFVIRQDFEKEFRSRIGCKYEDRIDTRYAYQSMDELPSGFSAPEGRTKPWGTAHAVWVARQHCDEPFAVINADDFYSADAYHQMAHFLSAGLACATLRIGMVGYHLTNTLSPHGSVNRGVCCVRDGNLLNVEEFTEIKYDKDGVLRGNGLNGTRQTLSESTVVSMNFWGFSPDIFSCLTKHFTEFLENYGTEAKSECYLPSVVNALVSSGRVSCPVLETKSPWFGVTYPEDKASVVENIKQLTQSGYSYA